MKKKHFHHEDGPAMEQSAHRGCAESTLVGFPGTAGKGPEKPNLISNPAVETSGGSFQCG